MRRRATTRHYDLLADIDTRNHGRRASRGPRRRQFTAGVLDSTIHAEIEALTSLAPLHNGPALAVRRSRMFPASRRSRSSTRPFMPPCRRTPTSTPCPTSGTNSGGAALRVPRPEPRLLRRPRRGAPRSPTRPAQAGHLPSGERLLPGGSRRRSVDRDNDGIHPARRSGDGDSARSGRSGVLTHLLAENRLTLPALEEALYHQSGLRGILAQAICVRFSRPAPRRYPCRARLRPLCGPAAGRDRRDGGRAHGIDALVFTGGVGEHTAEVRAAACDAFAWIGLALDDAVNASATPDAVISTGIPGSA